MSKKENKVPKIIKKIKSSENSTSEINSLLKPSSPSLKKKPIKKIKIEAEEKISQINPQLFEKNNDNPVPVAVRNTSQKKQTNTINKTQSTKIDFSKATPLLNPSLQNQKPNPLNNKQNETIIRPYTTIRLNPIQQKILQIKQTLQDNAQQNINQTKKIQETQITQKNQRNQQELIQVLNKTKQPLVEPAKQTNTLNNAIQTALKSAEQKIIKEKMNEKTPTTSIPTNSKPKTP